MSHNPKPLYFFWLAPWNTSGNQIPPVDQSGEPKSYTKCKEFFNYLTSWLQKNHAYVKEIDLYIHRAVQSYPSVSAINGWYLFLNYWPVRNRLFLIQIVNTFGRSRLSSVNLIYGSSVNKILSSSNCFSYLPIIYEIYIYSFIYFFRIYNRFSFHT